MAKSLEEILALSREKHKNQDYKDGWNDAIEEANKAYREIKRLKEIAADAEYNAKRVRELEEEVRTLKEDPKQSVVDKIVNMLIDEGQISPYSY